MVRCGGMTKTTFSPGNANYKHGELDGPHFWVIRNNGPIPDGTRIDGVYRRGKPWTGRFLEIGCEPASFVAEYVDGTPVAPKWFAELMSRNKSNEQKN